MADQADVEEALAGVAVAALYPQGSDAPSLPGPVCRVYRGWPAPAVLDRELALGHVHVAVGAVGESLRVTTRFPEAWRLGEWVSPALRVTMDGDLLTFSGHAGAGQLAGVLADGRAFVHRTEAGDTPELVAAHLATLIRQVRPAFAHGPVLAVPGTARLLARVAADQPAVKELRRQTQNFRIACFCPSPALRDTSAAAIDAVLAGMDFLDLPDGSAGHITCAGSASLDEAREAALYRRDLTYAVEYPTTAREMQASMLFGVSAIGEAATTN